MDNLIYIPHFSGFTINISLKLSKNRVKLVTLCSIS